MSETPSLGMNENLRNGQRSLLHLLPLDKELAIICRAGDHAAGYIILTEDKPNTSPLKLKASIAFDSRRFTTGQMSFDWCAEELLAFFCASDEFLRNV